MGEKLFKIKEGSKFTGYSWSISYRFVFVWSVRVLDIFFDREKKATNRGFCLERSNFF